MMWLKKHPVEDSEPARTCRTLLRTPYAEYSQSVASAPLGSFTAPNRDYPYEGLTALSPEGENWKFLDALFFGLRRNDSFLALRPALVEANPFKTIYAYEVFEAEEEKTKKGWLSAEYYLFRDLPALSIIFHNTAHGTQLVLKPLIDVRHVFEQSAPLSHDVRANAKAKTLYATKDNKTLFITSSDALSIQLSPAIQHWNYKLGDGARIHCGDKTVPKSEERLLLDAGLIFLKPCETTQVLVQCLANQQKPKLLLSLEKTKREETKRMRLAAAEIREFASYLTKAGDLWGANAKNALEARLVTLLHSFGVYTDSTLVPDAGAFWFRNVWFHDVFESLLTNFPLYYKLRQQNIKQIIALALKLQQNGLAPNYLPPRIGEKPAYNAVDATLLFYLVAFEYLKRERDEQLLRAIKSSAAESTTAFTRKTTPVILENGLLKTPANYSWADSVANGFPTRIPPEWVQNYGEITKNESYYLIETNALWIAFLRGLAEFTPLPQKILREAEKNFAKKFCGRTFPPHISHDKFEEISEESSHALHAMVLLPQLYSKKDVQRALETSEKKLFAYRHGKLFGVLTKNRGQKVFEGDLQYHGKTVWPRETPYLIALLKRVGDKQKIEELLLNALRHQENESTLFYSNELFGFADADNELIPVKNPAQYWSNWVQPYFDYFDSFQSKHDTVH